MIAFNFTLPALSSEQRQVELPLPGNLGDDADCLDLVG
jgi:hypothetical protein